MIVVIASLVLVATIGSAYVTFRAFTRNVLDPEIVIHVPAIGQGQEAAQQSGGAERPRPSGRHHYDAGVFTVNLVTDNRPGVGRFLRTHIILEAEDNRVVRDLAAREPELKDRIIAVLRSQNAADLEGEAGQARLKADVVAAVDGLLGGGNRVLDAFFQELVIQ